MRDKKPQVDVAYGEGALVSRYHDGGHTAVLDAGTWLFSIDAGRRDAAPQAACSAMARPQGLYARSQRKRWNQDELPSTLVERSVL